MNDRLIKEQLVGIKGVQEELLNQLKVIRGEVIEFSGHFKNDNIGRLLSIATTQLETSSLYIKEAIEKL